MSCAHIKALRTALENNHWVIEEERLVDEYRTTAYWEIARPDGTNRLTLSFNGGYDLDGIHKMTFEESYACEVVGHPDAGLYFARIHRSWRSELNQFIRDLNRLG